MNSSPRKLGRTWGHNDLLPAAASSPSSRCPDGSPHHWKLPTPNGPFAYSNCKKCGAEKAFRNALDDALGYGDGTVLRGMGRAEYS